MVEMRSLIFLILVFACGCEKAPARIVVGVADTVVVNTPGLVKLPVRVLDRTGRVLSDTSVRYVCGKASQATVHVVIGALATNALILCRPIRDLRATRMLNLIVGRPAQDLPFEAIGMDGQPVTLMSGEVNIDDSAIVAVDGFRIRAIAPGKSGVTVRVGNRTAFTNVQAYAVSRSPEGIRAGQRVAIPVRLMNGELQQWKLSPSAEDYFISMLPDIDEEHMPRIAIVGANCDQAMGPHSFFCLVRNNASVIAYYPQNIRLRETLSGNLLVWRQEWIP